MGLSVDIKKNLRGFSLDASWEIGNELAVLFGCSGAGKSLTLQLIAGLMRPDAGCVRLNGRTMFDSRSGRDLAPQERSFGYVFQDLALFPHMTMRDNILYGAHGLNRQEREQRTDAMIASFRLAGLEDKFPAMISGGQKQRAALARALIRRPDALLLDEPFSALDAPLRREMQQMLKDVRKEFGIPVILVTHDIDEARILAERVIVYGEGSVLQTGSAPEVFERPVHSPVRLLGESRDRWLFPDHCHA